MPSFVGDPSCVHCATITRCEALYRALLAAVEGLPGFVQAQLRPLRASLDSTWKVTEGGARCPILGYPLN